MSLAKYASTNVFLHGGYMLCSVSGQCTALLASQAVQRCPYTGAWNILLPLPCTCAWHCWPARLCREAHNRHLECLADLYTSTHWKGNIKSGPLQSGDLQSGDLLSGGLQSLGPPISGLRNHALKLGPTIWGPPDWGHRVWGPTSWGTTVFRATNNGPRQPSTFS